MYQSIVNLMPLFLIRSLRSYISVLNSVNKFVFSTGKELENIEQEKELDQHVVNLKFPVLIYQPTTNSLVSFCLLMSC